MNEPRHHDEYGARQTEAARRVLVDLGQVLASFEDCLVLVGGWVPSLLLREAPEIHSGSIDVDLALNTVKLGDGRYARLIESLLKTRRYEKGTEAFRLFTMVDLEDGEPQIRVDVDFLKPIEPKPKKNKPKLIPGFRPLDADGCAEAFANPEILVIPGQMIKGQKNKVRFRVASIADFLVMKSYALAKRDKPKDAYDICYCLDNYPKGMKPLALIWKKRLKSNSIQDALSIMRDKFSTPDQYGPTQVVEFYNSPNREEREMQARRAFELVQAFLKLFSK
jgi:Nucleotidyl transferase AbiEii toxin, Type IV TA system